MNFKVATAAAAALAAFCLSGCVSVFEGTSQDIAVVTNPTGARCAFMREDGMNMGSVESTPGRLTVRKSKYDLTITCKKEGYQDAAYINNSGTSATIAANVAVDLLLTAGISSIVDSANGADNKYDSVVNISMVPLTNTALSQAPVIPVANVTQGAPVRPASQSGCTQEEQNRARIARMNGYTGGPRCD